MALVWILKKKTIYRACMLCGMDANANCGLLWSLKSTIPYQINIQYKYNIFRNLLDIISQIAQHRILKN